jgi:hypothetical protein
MGPSQRRWGYPSLTSRWASRAARLADMICHRQQGELIPGQRPGPPEMHLHQAEQAAAVGMQRDPGRPGGGVEPEQAVYDHRSPGTGAVSTTGEDSSVISAPIGAYLVAGGEDQIGRPADRTVSRPLSAAHSTPPPRGPEPRQQALCQPPRGTATDAEPVGDLGIRQSPCVALCRGGVVWLRRTYWPLRNWSPEWGARGQVKGCGWWHARVARRREPGRRTVGEHHRPPD